MVEIVILLKALCKDTELRVRVLDENNNKIFDNLPNTESNITRKICINGRKLKITLEQDNIKLIPMIEYTLNKLIDKENVIQELIEGRKQWDSLEDNNIKYSTKLLLIEVNNKNEAFEIVENTYDRNEVYVGEIYDRIIVLGDLEDELDHALSLKGTIDEVLGVKSKVSISKLDKSFEGFIKGYRGAVQALEIGNKFKIKPEVYNINEMFLEKAIFNLSKEYTDDLIKEYKNIFNKFNYELIQTLEEVLKCDLSLTKAAKNLYIHRNTLMYRIEKIKKETGFDIRNFKEATFIYILYMNSKANV
ncbi:helix-turn-helix domain-containing protein [Clostridium sp. Sa3CUN1]|uniref:Helix-turn-helix domain-containing protein n=1 Tax=Clostridium gallinarum TaxID=2762246 RepID=A0ABR8Q3A9_9CLOT|nr:helix-turn-helix domain-containing protein [Clostridium gallinarum]MBD7914891.1 helix-turn-helix domain-containing protein [Clostridium gallinarum]